MWTILLVDDDPDMLELLRCNFEAADFNVHIAASGMEGLHHARKFHPNAIVLDVLLPDIDGMTVCELLRKHSSTAAIAIFMLTAVVGQMCRFAGLEAGADEHLTKPIQPGDLVTRVTRFLQRRAGQETADS